MENFEDHPYLTADGSHSLYAPRFNQHYHSKQGAIMESEHIFINLGLLPVFNNATTREVSVFEMGLGTGLNALLAWKVADELKQRIRYTAVEAYPIPPEMAVLLNYEQAAGKSGLSAIHDAGWGAEFTFSEFFKFQKQQVFLQDFQPADQFDVIFFDAFSPVAQPELWTKEVFSAMFSMLKNQGVLVTYSSKGVVRRAMQAAGFIVEKHPGPGYKREVVRALKSTDG